MKTFRLPATAIALSIAVLATAAGASANTTDTSRTQAPPAQAYTIALQSQSPAPRTVGNVNIASQGFVLSDFTTRALTPLQLNAAYDRFVQASLHIDPAIAHTP